MPDDPEQAAEKIAAMVLDVHNEEKKPKLASVTKYGFKGAYGIKRDFLYTNELALQLGFAVKTLERWRKKGEGPPFYKIRNGRIRYNIADVETWLDQTKVVPSPVQPP